MTKARVGIRVRFNVVVVLHTCSQFYTFRIAPTQNGDGVR